MPFAILFDHRITVVLLFSLLGMMITSLHLEWAFLAKIHAESLLLVSLFILNSVKIIEDYIKKNGIISVSFFSWPLLLLSWFILWPLVSSFFNRDYLQILGDGEYRSLIKLLALLQVMVCLRSQDLFKRYFADMLLIFYFLLGCYFIYRVFWLHEIREFDGRPTLKIRNGDPNFLCTFFAMNVPIALLKAMDFFKRKKSWPSVLMIGISLFFVACAFITESRMGIFSLIIGLSWLLWKNREIELKIKWVILTAIAAVLAVVFSFGSFTQRFQQIQDKSNFDRLLTYKNGLQLFWDHPVVGVGMHKAKDFFFENTQFPDFQSESKRLEVHNTFLSLLAELGLIGLSLYLALLFWVTQQILKLSGRRQSYFISSLLILMLSALSVGLGYKDLVFLHLFSLVIISEI